MECRAMAFELEKVLLRSPSTLAGNGRPICSCDHFHSCGKATEVKGYCTPCSRQEIMTYTKKSYVCSLRVIKIALGYKKFLPGQKNTMSWMINIPVAHPTLKITKIYSHHIRTTQSQPCRDHRGQICHSLGALQSTWRFFGPLIPFHFLVFGLQSCSLFEAMASPFSCWQCIWSLHQTLPSSRWRHRGCHNRNSDGKMVWQWTRNFNRVALTSIMEYLKWV